MTEDDSDEARPPHGGRGRHAAPDEQAASGTASPVDDVTDGAAAGTHAGIEPGPDAPMAADQTVPVPASEAPPAGGWRGVLARRRRRKDVKVRRKAPWWELPALVVLAIGIAILVKTFVIQPFYIPSASMENTLHGSDAKGHDRILVFKPIYDFRDPEPGDIVVFDAPNVWADTLGEPISHPPSNIVLRGVRGLGQLIGLVPPDGEVLVKRVIAVGGQTVKGDAAGHVMVSSHGTAGPFRTLKEPFVLIDGPSDLSFGPVTVPKGRLWVMGDHRNNSADSRYHCGPSGQAAPGAACNATESTVPIDNVIGKAVVIAWPPSHWRTLGTPSTFESASAEAGSYLPSVTGATAVLPVFAFRRLRRRAGR